ncbi:MAG: SRPBCC family protein, partial [Acidimicrobiia bacterium]|nr:SRPBCC family protein [Acidimicrobiia bacterium]
MAAHYFERSRTYPVSEEVAFDRTLAYPLPKLFRHRFGPIPAIKDVREQLGDFDTAGDARTIVLKGGATMREELVEVDRPWVFRYRITDITGPM